MAHQSTRAQIEPFIIKKALKYFTMIVRNIFCKLKKIENVHDFCSFCNFSKKSLPLPLNWTLFYYSVEN